jgi:hypothetical protein
MGARGFGVPDGTLSLRRASATFAPFSLGEAKAKG